MDIYTISKLKHEGRQVLKDVYFSKENRTVYWVVQIQESVVISFKGTSLLMPHCLNFGAGESYLS